LSFAPSSRGSRQSGWRDGKRRIAGDFCGVILNCGVPDKPARDR
jgi:hypothetical protein